MFGEELRKYMKPDAVVVDMVAQVTQHPDRPRPIRAVDQVFMLPGSQATQAMLAIDYLKYRDVVFVGDGDCMALVVAHLAQKGVFKGPGKIRIFDFDERLLAFIEQSINDLNLPTDLISVHHYNVLDPIPKKYTQAHEVFYTNPPYGSKDGGKCGELFLARCMEFCKPPPSWGIALLPYAHKDDWSRLAMANIQTFLCQHGYVVSEMIREIHQYHLEDRPSLRSCNLVVDRVHNRVAPLANRTFTQKDYKYFYGRNNMSVPKGINIKGCLVQPDGTISRPKDEPKWRNRNPQVSQMRDTPTGEPPVRAGQKRQPRRL
jgi:predicted methyltransferase